MLVKKSASTLRFGEFIESLKRANNIEWDDENDYQPDPQDPLVPKSEGVAPVNPWTLMNEDVYWSIISSQYFPNHFLLVFVRNGSFIKDTIALFDRHLSKDLVLHESILANSLDHANLIEKRNINWIKKSFLRKDFYDHVQNYPEYQQYLDGEDFAK